MCKIDIEPCNQAHRHLRSALADAADAVIDVPDDDEEILSGACEIGEHDDCRRRSPSGEMCTCACHVW